MFENMLAVQLVDGCHMTDDGKEVDSYQMTDDSDEERVQKNYKLQTTNYKLVNPSSQRIWLEDESQRIGKVNIPVALWNTIRQKPVCFLDIEFEERLNHIVQEYGNCEKEKLVDAILRIQKRLGGLEMKTALNFLTEGDMKESFRILLKYYDKQYLKALNKRDASAPLITKFESKKVGVENASALLHAIKHLA